MGDMITDRIALAKADGRRFEKIPAVVTPNMIHIDDARIPVEEGDHIERALPNGLLERYLVLDRGFYSGAHGIPDHYQIKVRKESAIPSRPPSVTYTATGPNARINVNSVDQSQNIVTLTQETVFPELNKAIQTLAISVVARERLLAASSAMEKAKGQPSFTTAYRDFMALAADHIGVFGPIIAFLATLLK